MNKPRRQNFRSINFWRTLLTAIAVASLASLLSAPMPQSADAASQAAKKKPRNSPYAAFSHCYLHARKAYEFGFLTDQPLNYTDNPPGSSPYTTVPPCRVTSTNPGDKPRNRVETTATFSGSNARVGVQSLDPAALDVARQAWPLYDSVGDVTLWITAAPSDSSHILWRFWSSDFTGNGNGTLLATRNISVGVAPIKVQGRACVADRNRVNDYLAVQFPNLRSELAGYESSVIGRPAVWGLVAAASINLFSLDPDSIRKLIQARKQARQLVDCGKTNPLSRHSTSKRFKLTSPPPFSVIGEHFLGGTSWQRCNPDDPTSLFDEEGLCGTYGSYWTIPGASVRVVSSTTTGIAGGGLPLAFLPGWIPFKAIRYLPYCDRNVPRVELPFDRTLSIRRTFDGTLLAADYNDIGHAFWIYGKFWIGGTTKYVYGWTVEPCSRLPEVRRLFKRQTSASN